jgi:transposase
MIQAVGAHLLYLPLCSGDLNPIEQLSTKLKTLLRNQEMLSGHHWRTAR